MKVLIYPDSGLKVKASPVRVMTHELIDQITEMLRLMKASQAIGLSATQVGLDARVFVTSVEVFINPVILKRSGKVKSTEGCVSLPGLELTVTRAKEIVVEYINLSGQVCQERYSGLMARLVQHEIDHLDGVLLFERAHNVDMERVKNWLRVIRVLNDRKSYRYIHGPYKRLFPVKQEINLDKVRQASPTELASAYERKRRAVYASLYGGKTQAQIEEENVIYSDVKPLGE